MQMRLLVILALLALGTAAFAAAKPASPYFKNRATDRIIVKYKDKHPLNASQSKLLASELSSSIQINAQLEPVRVNALLANIIKIRIDGKKPSADALERIVAELSKRSDVAYAEPDAIMHPFMVPNDTNYSLSQWDLQNTPGGANLEGAWDITTGSASDVIAVIDTGILPHAELSGKILDGYDFISESESANDLDGRDANASDPGDWCHIGDACYDPYNGESDSTWHGTHVAGTIAALSNNASGIAGINWQGKILPVRVLGKGGGYTSDVVDGMLWAAGYHIDGVPDNAHPAKVLNLSLGSSAICSHTYQNAIDQINQNGAIVVVAAGNEDTDATFANPASCNGVITVASVARDGGKAYYSNYGSVVEIAAPGGDKYIDTKILSTLDSGATSPNYDNTLVAYQGTSMAAPHISGIVSLVTSLLPDADVGKVTYILQKSAKAFPDANLTCNTQMCGAGIVDAASALAMANNPATSYDSLFEQAGYFDRNRELRYTFASAADIVDLSTSWYLGSGRLYSNFIDDNESTDYNISFDRTDLYDLSFDYDVSSESGYDGLLLSRNGVMTLDASGSTNLLDDYLYFRYNEEKVPVSGSALELIWSYMKDEAVTYGADQAWIDNLLINTYKYSEKATFPKGIRTKLIAIVNDGAAPLSISNVVLSNTAEFAVVNGCSEALTYGERCYLTLTYYGDYTATDETTLSFSTNDPLTPTAAQRFTMAPFNLVPVLQYLLF